MKFSILPLAMLAGLGAAASTKLTARQKAMQNTQQIDQVFLMDCTGSMGSYIQTAKDKITTLVDQLKKDYPYLKLRLAFIGYRDIDDWGKPSNLQYIEIPFTEDVVDFKQKLQAVKATGGGDHPEDVYTGLEAAAGLDWQSSVRLMTLLSDAPHNEKNGRKKYSDFKPLLEKLAHTGNDNKFYFNFFRIGGSTGDLSDKIRSMAPENMVYSESVLQVQNLWRGSSYEYGIVPKIGGGRPGARKEIGYARRFGSRGGFSRSFHKSIGPSRSRPRSESSYMKIIRDDISKAVKDAEKKVLAKYGEA